MTKGKKSAKGPKILTPRGQNIDAIIKKYGTMIRRVLSKPENKDCFLGVRDGFLNIYYRGGSMGKITNKDTIELAGQFWLGRSAARQFPDAKTWESEISKIKSNMDAYQMKKCSERVAQQELIVRTNSDSHSQWYCVDMEYASPRRSLKEQNYGRFDIVAISRKPIRNKHKILLARNTIHCWLNP